MALEAFDDEEGDPLRLAQADRTLGMTTHPTPHAQLAARPTATIGTQPAIEVDGLLKSYGGLRAGSGSRWS